MVAIEYGIVGALAGTLGAAGALAMSWAMARGLFDITWRPAPGLLGLGLNHCAALRSTAASAATPAPDPNTLPPKRRAKTVLYIFL